MGIFISGQIITILILVLVYILSRVTKTRFEDWLNPKRWKSVLTYLVKYLLYDILKDPLPILQPHEIEQYFFRIKSCEDCLPKNKCKSCGCNTIARMNVTRDSCSAGRWGPFMNKESWEKLKKDNNLILSVKVGDQDIKDIDF